MNLKYSFMSFSCPELTFQQMVELAVELGYAGIEPRVTSGHRHGVELEADAGKREQIRELAADAGIAICCLAVSCRYADPATVEENVRDTLESIDLAADIGAPRLRVFGGQIGGGLSRPEAIAQVGDSLRSCAQRAAQRKVTICVESHDDWSDVKHLATVMQRVDHPWVAVNWDVMHPVRTCGYSMDEAYQTVAPWIHHVHFHDGAKGNRKIAYKPIGEGFIDHRRVAEILREAGYDGFLSGEWIGWEPHQVHLPRELASMKKIERQIQSA